MVSVPWRIVLVLLAAAGLLTAAEPADPPAPAAWFPRVGAPPAPGPLPDVSFRLTVVVCTDGHRRPIRCPDTLFDPAAWEPAKLLEARAAFVRELVRGPHNCDEPPEDAYAACVPTATGVERRLAEEGYPDSTVRAADGRLVYRVIAGDACIIGRFDPATRSRGVQWVAGLTAGRACPA
nr:hypothetical protein GCM10020063_016740 [Dactylosporangium thailandense]